MLQVACGGKIRTGTYRIKCGSISEYVICTTGLNDDLQYQCYDFFFHRNGSLHHGERSYTKFDVEGKLIPKGSVPSVLPRKYYFTNGYAEVQPDVGGKVLLNLKGYTQLRYTFDQVITSSASGRYGKTTAMLILPAVFKKSGVGRALVVARRSSKFLVTGDIMSTMIAQANKLRYSRAEIDSIVSLDTSVGYSYYDMSIIDNPFKRPVREPFVNLDWLGLLDQYEPNFTSYDEKALLGEMSQDIADDIRPYQTNVYASLAELPASNPFNTLSQVVRTAGVSPLRAASDIALESQYGFNLTVQDAQAFAHAMLRARDLSRVYRSSRSISYKSMWGTKTSIFHAKAKVRRESSKVISLIDDLYSTGIMPTLEGAWDLIPFSFVIDWFLPISDSLKQLDAGPKLASLPLEYVLLSEDKALVLDDEAVSRLTRCNGEIVIHRYKRWIQSTLPPVCPQFTGLQKPHPNWVAAAALLVRRKS